MIESEALPTMFVCDGCCCGRTEKGHAEVPVNKLKTTWKKEKLDKKINLKISNCLGYCSLHNVTVLKNKNKKTWIGKLSSEEHYKAVIEWAENVALDGVNAKMPNILVPHLFLPTEM